MIANPLSLCKQCQETNCLPLDPKIVSWRVPVAEGTARQERPRDDKQAVLAEPPMLVQLEQAIEAQCQVGDPRWMALLGQWIQAAACMRCALDEAKKGRNRKHFYFAIPSAFTSGWDWTDPWVKAFEQLPVAKRAKCGLCFDGKGFSWSLREFNLAVQAVFAKAFDKPEELTFYAGAHLTTER
ncbi:unnamed protein product [Symbiodinium necroappetens]|uniref:Uncharacterized protein n=1 Tax=Symbiodinium necroappetens TaxID=1628268 RepID=A0A812VCV8_9DINO|nr:unnamed protein product [Symbiodinium necroappetens]